ncbi:MAG: hypothetical protein QM674_03440 [Burkholderiaceae bacterium]
MPSSTLRLITAAGLLAAALPVVATGISSSISDSVGESVGSVSDSIERSSDSSSKTTGLAEGDYRITQVALADGRPAMTRLTLRAAAANDDGDRDGDRDAVFLYVPTDLVERHALAQGGSITARHRPYGIEFTAARAPRPFFLVVHDEVRRDLDHHVVTL